VTQNYVPLGDVQVPPGTPRPSRRLLSILERDGQIVPLLVRLRDGGWIAADHLQGERVLALRELQWPTILIEDTWSSHDLW
jgi:hypothetical protein